MDVFWPPRVACHRGCPQALRVCLLPCSSHWLHISLARLASWFGTLYKNQCLADESSWLYIRGVTCWIMDQVHCSQLWVSCKKSKQVVTTHHIRCINISLGYRTLHKPDKYTGNFISWIYNTVLNAVKYSCRFIGNRPCLPYIYVHVLYTNQRWLFINWWTSTSKNKINGLHFYDWMTLLKPWPCRLKSCPSWSCSYFLVLFIYVYSTSDPFVGVSPRDRYM